MNESLGYVCVYMISFLVSSFFFSPHTLIHYNTLIHIHPTDSSTLRQKKSNAWFDCKNPFPIYIYTHTLGKEVKAE
jgi:hypothetical protein